MCHQLHTHSQVIKAAHFISVYQEADKQTLKWCYSHTAGLVLSCVTLMLHRSHSASQSLRVIGSHKAVLRDNVSQGKVSLGTHQLRSFSLSICI